MRKILIRLVILGALVGAAWASYRFVQQLPQRQQQIATTKVRQGDIVVKTYTRGELRAVRSTTLIAPNLFGTVQITKLAEVGSFAREKDLVVEFDDAELISRLEEKQLEIDQIEEQYKKAEADLAIRNNSDQVELLRARFSVRRGELEVKRNELLSPIDAKKNELNLEESKRRLKQLESDIQSRHEQAEAELAVLREKKQKALLELDRERARLNQVKILAPMSGLVAIRQNLASRMGFGFDVPDIREGDQVQPGMPIADVLDLSDLEVVARVGELDRANLTEGQDALLGLDALPGRQFHGKIKSMSSTASANVMSSDPAKKFDVIFSVDMRQLLGALGAKPEEVARLLAIAEANRNKPPMSAMAADAPAAGPEGPPTVGPTAPGAAGEAGNARAKQNADRAKMRAALAKLLKGRELKDLPAAEREKIMAQVQKETGISPAAAGGNGGGNGNGNAGGARRGGRFTDAEIKNAKLPPPPDQDSQLDVLLRPGLLADVEIIVEKIPNAVNIPAQAVFERDGKLVVYVKNRDKFEARVIRPFKRSDSTLIVAEGLKKDEVVALTDPEAKPGAKGKQDKGGSGGPMNALPGGKS